MKLLKPSSNQLKDCFKKLQVIHGKKRTKVKELLKLENLILAAIAAFSVWLMFSTFGYKDNQFTMGSKLWSDFAAHLPLIRSFSLGANFPPEYPQFANEPIRYHYLFYLPVGLLERIGVNVAFALNFLSAAGMVGLLMAIFYYAKLFSQKITHKKLAVLAGTLAVLLFLFNGSLTFVSYFNEDGWSWQALIDIPNLIHFVDFGPWSGDIVSAFWNWNIYTNQRHLAFSFGLSLWLLWPLVKTGFEQKKFEFKFSYWQLVFLWLGLALLPYLNLAAFGMTVIFIVMWLGLNPTLIKKLAPVYLIGLFFSLPGFLHYWQLSSENLRFKLGYLAAAESLPDIFHYWLHNLGLYLFLWPLLLIVSQAKIRKWLLIFSVFFILANTFQLSTDLINNHKLINFFQIGLVISLAPLLVKVWSLSWLAKPVVFLLVIPLIFSGFINAWPVINDSRGYLDDSAQQQIGSWLQEHTRADGTVVTTHYMYNPASLAGRKTYLDYGYFAWSMGYDSNERRKNLDQIFSPEISEDDWCQLAKQEEFDYVLISPGQGDLDLPLDQSWLVRENSQIVKELEDYRLYSVNMICLE